MDVITKVSITKLSKRAGIKCISDDCYDTIKQLIESKLAEVLHNVLIVNSENKSKTIMNSDVYTALEIMGEPITQSNDLGLHNQKLK
jgi:histone H3/H4